MNATYIDELSLNFRLDPARCALLVVDMQYASGSRSHGLGRYLTEQGRISEAQYRFDRLERLVVPNTQRLLERFRSIGAHVIFLTLGSELEDFSDAPPHLRNFFRTTNNRLGQREHEIIDEVSPIKGEPVLNKKTQGAFASTGIDNLLRSLDVQQLVLVGVSTNNCVETTAREAADRCYQPVLVADATGTCSDEFQDVTLRGFSRLWGRVMSTDAVLEEIAPTAASA